MNYKIEKNSSSGFAFIPLVLVVVAVIALCGGGVAIYKNIKHGGDENKQLRNEITELRKDDPSPTPEVTNTPTPVITPKSSLSSKPESKVQGVSTTKLAIKTTPTPTTEPTKQPTPIPVKVSPTSTQSAEVSIELCKASAKKAVDDVKEKAMQNSPGVSLLANAVSLGDAEQVALKYGYLSQYDHDKFEEFMANPVNTTAVKQGMAEAYYMDIANLQKWAVKKLEEVDSILIKEENDIYQKCLSSL